MPPIVGGLEFFGDLSSARTSIVSGAVATLGDASGNARDFTQSTGSKRPTYTASDATFGGRPSMTFDGVDDFLVSAAIQWPGTSITVFAVFRTSTVAIADQRVFGSRPGAFADSVCLRMNTNQLTLVDSHPVGSETQKTTTVAANTTYRVGFVQSVSSAGAQFPSLYVNGASAGAYTVTSAGAGTAFTSCAHGIGAGDIGNSPLSGSITDVLVYAGALSASQIATVDDWLKWRNGL